MSASQRICQIFATLIVLVIIFGTMIDCAGMAGKVLSFMAGGE